MHLSEVIFQIWQGTSSRLQEETLSSDENFFTTSPSPDAVKRIG